MPTQLQDTAKLNLLLELIGKYCGHRPHGVCIVSERTEVQPTLLVVPGAHVLILRNLDARDTADQWQKALEE